MGWISRKLYQRRLRLVRKWRMTGEFTRRTIGDKLVMDFLILLPEDGEQHVAEAHLFVRARRDKPLEKSAKVKIDGKPVGEDK